MIKQKLKNIYILIIFNIVGSFLYAVGINCFAAPHNIAPGGASGVAILVNYLFNFPIGVFVLVFNIPFLIWIFVKKYFSNAFIFKTLATTALLSFITDYIVIYIPIYKGDALLASMFGGALMGIGLAIVHLGNSNTGGISLLGIIIQKINPKFQVGALISSINIIIVLVSGFIYKNIESLLYAVVTVYISGIFMDKILEQVSKKNLVFIMSECTDIVRKALVDSQKTVTILKGEGGYSSKMQRVLICATTKDDCIQIEKIVKSLDDKALIIVTETKKMEGKGFKNII